MNMHTLMLGNNGYGELIPHPTFETLDEAVKDENIIYPPFKSDAVLAAFRHNGRYCVYAHFEERYIDSHIPDGSVIVLLARAQRTLEGDKWIWSHDDWKMAALMPRSGF